MVQAVNEKEGGDPLNITYGELLKLRNRLCRDHRTLVEDYHRYAGTNIQPGWQLVASSAQRIVEVQEEIESLNPTFTFKLPSKMAHLRVSDEAWY